MWQQGQGSCGNKRQEERHMLYEWVGGQRGIEGEGGLGTCGLLRVGCSGRGGAEIGAGAPPSASEGLFGEEASARLEVLQVEGPVGSQAPVPLSACGGETKVIRYL